MHKLPELLLNMLFVTNPQPQDAALRLMLRSGPCRP